MDNSSISYTPNPPRIDTLFDEKNNFLQLLLKQLKNKKLIINDSVEVIAPNSDTILKELKDNGTDQIKLLLKNEIYNKLPEYTSIVLREMNNGLTINKNINPSDELLRKTFNKNIKYKYNDQLSTVIIYHILTSSLEISARSDFSIKNEKKFYQEYCCDDEIINNNLMKTKIFSTSYINLICRLCNNSKSLLTHSLNIDDGLKICMKCTKRIELISSYWNLYKSMLNWDKGWNLLFNIKDDEPYRMIGILTSIVFRYYYHLINTK